MSKLYAAITSTADKDALSALATRFSHSIELLDDGVLFDVSGLDRLMGKPDLIAQKILKELKKRRIAGSVAVAETIETATLLARRGVQEGSCTLVTPDKFEQLPLSELDIEQDMLNVFKDLGLRRVSDLLAVPKDDLVNRYGREFESIIRTIQQKGDRLLKPNVKEHQVAWSFILDNAVEDFEQLIFLLNHGLETLFAGVSRYGHSTEQLDITFKLSNRQTRTYEIKTSFPTLERSFWLKLINLRVSLDPPEAGITMVDVTAHFTKPRPAQRGLYAVSRPEPESLLLTVNKLKKLVGEPNIGVPVLLDQRVAETFMLDADKLPEGKETVKEEGQPIVAFTYFRPPLSAEVEKLDGGLFIKTREFSGYVAEISGVWKANSKWWDKPWQTLEWDVEIEDRGVYRLTRTGNEWFFIGEYD